jgi:glycosyltransferase involved in cell wall biosynthesis
MRVAIISDGVHPYVIGGMQRHTYYLCKYLSLAGVKVTLYHFNNSDLDIQKMDIFTESERQNIESIVIPFPKSNALPGHYIRDSYNYSCLIYSHIKTRIDEFDFIYSKGFSAWKLIEEKSKGRIKCPPIGVKFHGYEMFQKQANFKSLLQSYLLRGPVRWISKNADYVFSYGSKITNLIESLGINNNRIIEIPAGIEKDWISQVEKPQNEIRKFVYLGRYERRKGIEELNSVLNELIKQNIDFEFHFIGPFEKEQQIQSNLIHYHGSITDNARIRAILDASDCLVCPSWSEGMPNVILEAMSRSCAIIASDVGAVSIEVDHSNGILIEPGNKKQLKNALLKFLALDNETIAKMQKASLQKIINKFEYSIIIKEVVSKIKNTIN